MLTVPSRSCEKGVYVPLLVLLLRVMKGGVKSWVLSIGVDKVLRLENGSCVDDPPQLLRHPGILVGLLQLERVLIVDCDTLLSGYLGG